MKKVIIGIVIVISVVFVALFISIGGAKKDVNLRNYQELEEGFNDDITTGKFELREYDFLMKGKNNTSLFIDSVDSDDYDELIKILYPNGIVDEQGQEIGIIENATAIRKDFINEHTKAYTVIDGITKDVELEPFYINLDELSNELYNSSFEGSNEYLFYKAVVGDDVFVFPSEWGNQPFGFIEASEDNSYYIYWYLGIWKINIDNLTISKITSDEYNGKSYIDIRNEMNADNDEGSDNDGDLVWVDSAEISPNNEYIIYRTNRDSENFSETSIWKLDLNTGVEEQVIVENLNNDIVGFASSDVIVVGSTGNTRLVNVKNLNVSKIEIPQVENMSVQSAKNGKLIYKTYKEGRSDYTTILNELDLETGKITELDRFVGYYSTLKNVENMSYNDLLYLQNDVDNGHYSWRLKPEDVVYEYWYNLYGISNGIISNIEYTDLNEAIVEYTLNNQTYELSLVQPIKKGDIGIWVVRECELSEKDELVKLAYQKSLEILDSKELVSIETSQYILYEDEKTCDIEFPISSSDYFIVATYIREDTDSSWKFNEVQKLTTNQIISSEYALITDDDKKVILMENIKLFSKEPIAEKEDRGDGFHWIDYTYDDIEVTAMFDGEDIEQYAHKIVTTSQNYKTPRNIKVGDSLSKLQEAYTEYLKNSSVNSEKSIYVYDNEDEPGLYRIFFELENDVITKITIENGIDG